MSSPQYALTFTIIICIFHIGDKTKGEIMDLITASDALELTKVKVEVTVPTRQDIINNIIKYAAKKGNTSVIIPDYIIYNKLDDSVGEKIIREIRNAGYYIDFSLESKNIAIGPQIHWE